MRILQHIKALADETRLRLMNLLSQHELNVNEITRVMSMGQSRISRHLKILSDSDLIIPRRDGLLIFYKINKDNNFMNVLLPSLKQEKELQQDLQQLEKNLDLLKNEKAEFFNDLAPKWDSLRNKITGNLNIFELLESVINKADTAADIGCGTGDLIPFLTTKAQKVIGIDRSPAMLEEARKKIQMDKTIDFRLGEIEHLPMKEKEADTAVINMVLHHVPDPSAGIKEVHRTLKKKGLLVILDLDKHKIEAMRNNFGHRWLGFSAKELSEILQTSGFDIIETKKYKGGMGLSISLTKAVKK